VRCELYNFKKVLKTMYKEIMCNFDNIYKAYKIAHRGKSDDKEVIEFDKNKMYNLNKILKLLQSKKWNEIFKYYRFKLFVPKERVVDALTFEGRIVQHILCDNILKPYFEPRLIKENSACRENKGTLYALKLCKSNIVKYLKHNEDGYCLKMDVKKYFPSIDRTILKDLIKDFPDFEIKELLFYIIDNSPEENGLPVGNQTSQWFALYYLNKIDRIIKEKYGIKYYVRYMDDLIIIHKSKDYLKSLLNELKANDLKLIFNKKTQIFPIHKGISFLGWKFYYKNKKIITRIDTSKKRLRQHNLNKIKRLCQNDYLISLRSMIVNLRFGDTYYYMKALKML
jgi:RNA-directed DNA polymerase